MEQHRGGTEIVDLVEALAGDLASGLPCSVEAGATGYFVKRTFAKW
jgi:hypothetical protein